MYSYNEKDTVGKLVSNFWKISRVLRDTYDGRGSQRRVLTVLLKSGDVITQSVLTERLDIQPGSASEVLAKLEAAGLIQRTANDKDRRTINISLTENGRVAAQEVRIVRQEGADLAGLETVFLRLRPAHMPAPSVLQDGLARLGPVAEELFKTLFG